MLYAVLSAGLICAFVLAGVPACAGEENAPAPVAAPAPAAAPAPGQNPDEVICRTEGPVTGSLMAGKRKCFTRKQWKDIQERSQQDIQSLQQRGLGISKSGG